MIQINFKDVLYTPSPTATYHWIFQSKIHFQSKHHLSEDIIFSFCLPNFTLRSIANNPGCIQIFLFLWCLCVWSLFIYGFALCLCPFWVGCLAHIVTLVITCPLCGTVVFFCLCLTSVWSVCLRFPFMLITWLFTN